MISARPLYDNAADQRYFVEPIEWPTLLRAVNRRVNVLLTGERGVGKTSALHQLQLRLRTDNRNVKYINGEGTLDASDLASRLRAGLDETQRGLAESMTIGVANLSSQQPPPGGASRQLYSDLLAINDSEACVVLLDASGSGSAVYELFGRHRDTIWQGPHVWVVAVDRSETSTVLSPPGDAFFDVMVEIGPWKPEQFLELLQRRTDDLPSSQLGVIAEQSLGNPRKALNALAGSAVSGVDASQYLNDRTALEQRAFELGRPHSMLMAEILDRGQVSASDEDLQSTLGVSRARLSQLFQTLEKHELVEAFVKPRSGPGRPRTLYRPKLTR